MCTVSRSDQCRRCEPLPLSGRQRHMEPVTYTLVETDLGNPLSSKAVGVSSKALPGWGIALHGRRAGYSPAPGGWRSIVQEGSTGIRTFVGDSFRRWPCAPWKRRPVGRATRARRKEAESVASPSVVFAGCTCLGDIALRRSRTSVFGRGLPPAHSMACPCPGRPELGRV